MSCLSGRKRHSWKWERCLLKREAAYGEPADCLIHGKMMKTTDIMRCRYCGECKIDGEIPEEQRTEFEAALRQAAVSVDHAAPDTDRTVWAKLHEIGTCCVCTAEFDTLKDAKYHQQKTGHATSFRREFEALFGNPVGDR